MPAVAEVRSIASQSIIRTIRVGVLGLGQVGQAVARLAPGNRRLEETGLKCEIVWALVRDLDRVRDCPMPARLTSDPDTFLRGEYDVVIEALGSIEPGYDLICRLLARGIPVVTANKALVARHGRELSSRALRHGTTLRYEASALAGVPFLGALRARPLVSDVEQFLAIVNGTSNFILSTLESERTTFAAALAQAQSLGLTEPDPSLDLDGVDAADKLSLLVSVFGWGDVGPQRLDVAGIRNVMPQDLEVARTLGATIKPVAWARRSAAGVSAFIGPALLPSRHPLAALAGTLCGIQLSGRYVSDLCFSGPGAGPDVTAATLVDDVVEAVSTVPHAIAAAAHSAHSPIVTTPETGWFVTATFPGVVPDAAAATHIFRAQGLDVAAVTAPVGDALWVRVRGASRQRMNDVVAALAHTHRVKCRAIRSLVS